MAAPALYWWRMMLNLSKQDGVRRAHTALATTATGKISVNASSATLVSENFIATISCFSRGSKTETVMIVAGQDGRETRGILEELKSGMRSGIFE